MFPVRDRATTLHAASTTPTYNYPQRVAAGDTLIAFIGADGNTNPAVPTGWNNLGLAQVGSNANGRAMWRKADGSEAGSTFGVTLSANVLSGAIVWAIQGLDPDSDPPEAASTTSASHTTSASVAPSLTPSGGSRPYLWLTAGSMDSPLSANTLLAGWPASGFTQFWQGSSLPSGSCNTVHGAERVLTASTLNPGTVGTHTFGETSVFWVCFTIAVPLPSAPPSNFPAVESAATTGDSADETNHLVTLPSGIQVGDLLLAETSIFDENATVTFTPPAGWTAETLVRNGGSSSSNRNAWVLWWRIADGTETSPVTFTTNEARRAATIMRRISGAVGFEYTVNVDGADAFPDPPLLAPSWGELDNLWIAGAATPGALILRRPALNVGDNKAEAASSGAGSNANVASGVGYYTLDEVNPSTLRVSNATFRWIAYTIAAPGPPPGPPVPDTPVNVTATAISSTQIRVDWTDVAFETGYRIERSDDGITGWAPVGTTAANVVTFVDGGLLPETEYCYRVVAFNDDGESDPSDVACATTFPEATTIPNPAPGSGWLRHPTIPALDMAVCVTETYERTRPFMAVQPIGGGLPTVVTGRPGGRNYTLVIAVRSINEQRHLEDILSAPLVYYQPPCDRDLWMAPDTESITVTKIGRIRQTTVDFVETGPFPQPTPESIFAQPFPPPEEPEEP